MLIKLSETAGFPDKKFEYTFDEEQEIIVVKLGDVFEEVDLSSITQKMISIEYDEPTFNEYNPIRGAERDGGGELLVEVAWFYGGNADQVVLEKEWNGAEELWQKLYQKA